MVNLKTQLVKPNFQIKQMKEDKTLMDYVEEEVKNIDLKNLKLEPDFIKYIAELIENFTEKRSKEDEKVNKLETFKSIVKKLFKDIKEEDLKTAIGILEFLLKNKLVKKTKLSKIILFFLQKKFGLCQE